MRPPEIAGVVYDKEFVNELRESCIIFRNSALKHDRFDWAVTLSYVIAFITIMAEELDA